MSSILNEYGKGFLEKLVTLSPDKKLTLGLTYINRQSELFVLFDDIYKTDFHDVFCKYIQLGIDVITANESITID
ncbi:hypothetical protein B0C58_004685, partial [Salmonella enterica subsp. enterica serovar Oranienburg]|nr:hypothetical protein [Salmonella enterica subsp. enterica serovar Oranienburg]